MRSASIAETDACAFRDGRTGTVVPLRRKRGAGRMQSDETAELPPAR
jgi:hypothetical protein